MTATTIETGFYPSNLRITGEITMNEGGLNIPIGRNPLNVITDDQDLIVRFKYDLDGVLIGSLYGHWHLGIHFERIGSGEGPSSVQWEGNNQVIGSEIDQTIRIPAGHFAPVLLQGQNIWRVVATIVFHKPGPPYGMPIAGFQDQGLLMVYNDGR